MKIKLVNTFFTSSIWKLIILIFISEFLLSILIISVIYFNQYNSNLKLKISQVKNDISFSDEKWNLSYYNSDVQLLGSYPLFLITDDGYVLDRRKNIHGFLDTTDLEKLDIYEKPQTIRTITGQERRVFTNSIKSEGKEIGIISVSYFSPKEEIIDQIDEKLKASMQLIKSMLSVEDGKINVNKIDKRKIPYDISYAVVDNYNSVLSKTTNLNAINRVPSYIDPSYIKSYLGEPKNKIIKDGLTGEIFFIKSNTINDKTKKLRGVIIIGQSIKEYAEFIKLYSLSQLILGTIVLIGSAALYSVILSKKQIKRENLYIKFNASDGQLNINNETIQVPYATNQYYFLISIVGKPEKRWENDELLEKFGEDAIDKNSRKVYDTMIKINDKTISLVGEKIILYQNKTYRLNPIFKLISQD